MKFNIDPYSNENLVDQANSQGVTEESHPNSVKILQRCDNLISSAIEANEGNLISNSTLSMIRQEIELTLNKLI